MRVTYLSEVLLMWNSRLVCGFLRHLLSRHMNGARNEEAKWVKFRPSLGGNGDANITGGIARVCSRNLGLHHAETRQYER
jgi:hypothetical protein